MDGEISSRLRRRPHTLSYRYSDSDSESDIDFGATSSVESAVKGYGLRTRHLPTRSSQRLRIQCNDSRHDGQSSVGSVTSTLDRSENELPPSLPYMRRSSIRSCHKKRFVTVSKNSAFQGFKRRKTINHEPTLRQVKPHLNSASVVHSNSGRIPPWQDLEYQLLLQIMQYAAYPLYEGASRDTGSIRWLLNTSMLCSSFHEACIGALMVSPPLLPAHRAHWLLSLLKASARDYGEVPRSDQRNGKLSLDYRKKVRCLNIEVKQLLVKKQGIDLIDLLAHTPLLKDLQLYHNYDALDKDFIWAQPQYAKGKKWSYGNLFDTLDQNRIELKSFVWNGRFLRQDPEFKSMIQAHRQKSLQRLRSVDLLHLNVYNGKEVERQMANCRISVLKALNSLEELKHLSIRNCDILDASTVAALPSGLQSLAIDDCIHVTSDALCDYLATKGSSLKVLKLFHNQSMSLEFMHTLQVSAPRLQYLEVDLTYHDVTSFSDTEPLFDSLLPSGPPTWPSSLSVIVMGPLRALSSADAEGFYESLVSAASNLQYLRELRLKTFLKEASWRDRADLRAKWSAKMNEVFLGELDYGLEQGIRNKRKSSRIQQVERRGRCHTVEFELSDQRPAQDQYKEADFLDSEPSDDGEWRGRDDVLVPAYSSRRYAW